jgi:hypothetical protein
MAFRDRHLSNDDVEQLLAGAPLDSPDLDELLAAASAPAQPDELTGLDDAIVAFRAAPGELAAGTGHRGRFAIKTLASGVLATKIVAGAVGAAAVGGVALAAGVGHVGQQATSHRISSSHAPLTVGATQRHAQSRTAAHTSPAPTASVTSRSTHSPRPSTSAPGRSVARSSRSNSPSPALLGLCRAWEAQKAHTMHPDFRGRWDDNPAFSALITAAGSPSAVDQYCTSLLLKVPGSGKVTLGHTHHITPTPAQGHGEGKPILLPTPGPQLMQPDAVARGGPQ